MPTRGLATPQRRSGRGRCASSGAARAASCQGLTLVASSASCPRSCSSRGTHAFWSGKGAAAPGGSLKTCDPPTAAAAATFLPFITSAGCHSGSMTQRGSWVAQEVGHLGARPDAELAVHPGQDRFHGTNAYEQLLGCLAIRRARRHGLSHAPLRRG